MSLDGRVVEKLAVTFSVPESTSMRPQRRNLSAGWLPDFHEDEDHVLWQLASNLRPKLGSFGAKFGGGRL